MSGCGKFSPGHGKRIQIRAGEHGVQSVLVFLQTTIRYMDVHRGRRDAAGRGGIHRDEVPQA